MTGNTIGNTNKSYVLAALPFIAMPIQEVPLLSYALANKNVNALYHMTASTNDDVYMGLMNGDPYTSQEQKQRDLYEINDTDWHSVSFEGIYSSSICHLALHQDWITRHGYVVDGIVNMNLPEQGISGPFRITSIKHITPQKKPVDEDVADDFEYRPVTGLFVHESNDVWKIKFDDGTELGVTNNHPIFSVSKSDWQHAGHLEIGEEVLAKGGNAKVVSKERDQTVQPVYNLEVKDLHNFLAASIIVHNNCVPVGGEEPCFKLFKEILNDYRKKLDDLLGDKISTTIKDRLVQAACKVVNIEGLSIKWDQFGFPDFLSAGAVFNIGSKIANYPIEGMIGDNYHDYKKAADQMKVQFADEVANGSMVFGSDHRVTINGENYTWHHHQGGKHMQLVKRSIHEANLPHLGGNKLAQEGLIGHFPDVELSKKFKCK